MNLFSQSGFENALAKLQAWLLRDVLIPETLVQIAAILTGLIVAYYAGPRLSKQLQNLSQKYESDWRVSRLVESVSAVAMPVLWLVIVWVCGIGAAQASYSNALLEIATSLLAAWVVVRIVTRVILAAYWAKLIASVVWILAALNILDVLNPAVAFLDNLAVDFGNIHISVLGVLKGVLALAILMWAASVVSRVLERRIEGVPDITPSVQVLFVKLLKIVLFSIAILLALSIVGIDITAFAVFGGALGVGLGFGLQKVASNLASGILLLLDKSIKPGDVISIGQTYGWIKSLGARYTSVITRDNIEHIIPNEDLITQRVENWSYSDTRVRLRLPFGISYNSNPRQAIELAVASVENVDRVLEDPIPKCQVKGFGDSSIDMELRIWIQDPQNGVANVKSEVYLNMWDKFQEHGIRIPFPQRDVHLDGLGEIQVRLARDEKDNADLEA